MRGLRLPFLLCCEIVAQELRGSCEVVERNFKSYAASVIFAAFGNGAGHNRKNYTIMKIKGMDGQEYHVTGQGQGNFNTVGAAGGIGWIAEKVFGGNFLGGNRCGCGDGSSTPISRYEAGMMNEMSAKDSKIALLEAQIYTDQQTDKKVSEAIAFVRGEVKELAAEVRANKDAQNAINLQQAVYNGVNTAAVECIKGQIAQLMGLTKLVVPNGSVCPGWGNVTVTPATTTTGA